MAVVGNGMQGSIPQRLREWFKLGAFQAVELIEDESPANSEIDDYFVAYTAEFRTSNLEQASLEVWITTEGTIGVGLEKRNRIANRVGVRTLTHGFAAGFEPCEKNVARLFAFLEIVRLGKIAIQASVWPLVGLGKTEAVVLPEWIPDGNFEFGPERWMRTVASLQGRLNLHTLTFHPWS